MRHLMTAAAAFLAVLMLLPDAPARAETVATLQNGQRLTGTVPKGEIIRLRFPLPEGSEPRLKLTLKGSPITLSILRSDLYDPDGNLIPDTSRFFQQRLRRNRSTLKLRDFVAPKSGLYELVVETNSEDIPRLADLRASGRLKVKRPKKIKVELDENDLSIGVGLQANDLVRAKVKRLSGGTPTIAAYVTPAGTSRPPPQKETKKGAKTSFFRATQDAEYRFEFGYRPGSTEGDFQVQLRVKPTRSPGTAVLRLANAPGIPLSVRPADRSTVVTFGTGAPGLAYDGSVLLISALRPVAPPDIAARFHDRDLFALPGTQAAVSLANQADVGAQNTIAGHKLAFVDNRYVVAFWTADGSSVWLSTYDRNFQSDNGLARKTGLTSVTTTAVTPITDPFLATDGERVSLGLFVAPDGHDVHVYESSLVDVGVLQIGGGAYAHADGAGVAWNDDAGIFELWAPDTLVPTLPSDLHRQRYTELWQPVGPEAKPIADAGVTEMMPSAVSYDAASGTVIVHFVVPTNAITGDGVIHRAIFDANGALVPGSLVELPGDGRNRPTSVIVGGSLFLGTSSPAGPLVERYPLLR